MYRTLAILTLLFAGCSNEFEAFGYRHRATLGPVDQVDAEPLLASAIVKPKPKTAIVRRDTWNWP